MLPFQKRSVQGNQADDISTEDVVEVVHKVRHAANAALSSRLGSTLRSNDVPAAKSSRRHGADRPRVPAPIPTPSRPVVSAPVAPNYGEDEDEMTCLMPAKGLIIPPPATRRAPVANVMSSNTSFRPAALPRMAPQAPMYGAREATPHDARSIQERRVHRMQPMAVVAARQETGVVPAAPASLAPMAMPLVDSEPHINPGATVLTARSLKSRPTASWAAALVAMGIFAGLVTAAVARGDFSPADSKVAAASQQVTAVQVIPSQPQSQPAASPVLPSSYMPTAAAPMAISAPAQSNPIASEPVAVAAKFSPTPKAASKASAPAPRVVSHPAAPAADKSEPKVEAKADVKEEKKVASKGKKDKDDSLASAKEAQALADAQLAASL